MDYSAYAHIYKKSALAQASAANILIELVKPFGNEDILDLGCGPGHITKKFREITTGNVVGIDKSPSMVQEAKKAYSNSKIEFILKDAEDLNETNKYDLIFCNSVFHWLVDQNKALSNAFLALKSKGRFALQTPISKDWCPQITSIINEVGSHPSINPYFIKHRSPWTYHGTKENYIRLFESHGFSVIFSKVQDMKNQNTFEEIVGIFNSGAASAYFDPANYTCDINREYIEQFKFLFKEKLKDHLCDEKMETTFHRLFLIAEKP